MRRTIAPILAFALVGCATSPPPEPAAAPAVPVIEAHEEPPLPFSTHEVSPRDRWARFSVRDPGSGRVPDEVILDGLDGQLRVDVAAALVAPRSLEQARDEEMQVGMALSECRWAEERLEESDPDDPRPTPCDPAEVKRLREEEERVGRELRTAEKARDDAVERATRSLDAAAGPEGAVALAQAKLAEQEERFRPDVGRFYGEPPSRTARDLERFAELYRAAEKATSPDDESGAWARYRHAVVLQATGDAEGALSRLTELTRRAPAALNERRAEIWLRVGLLRARQGDHAEAVEALERVRAAEPRNGSAAMNARSLLPVAYYRAGDLDAALEAAIDELDHVSPFPSKRDDPIQARNRAMAAARQAGILGVLSAGGPFGGSSSSSHVRLAVDILQRRGWESLPGRTTDRTRRRLAFAMALRAMDLGRRDEAFARLQDARGAGKRQDETIDQLAGILQGTTLTADEEKKLVGAIRPPLSPFAFGQRETFEDQIAKAAVKADVDIGRRVDRLVRLCLEPSGPLRDEGEELRGWKVTVEATRFSGDETWRIRSTVDGGEMPPQYESCMADLAPTWLFDAEGSVRVVADLHEVNVPLPEREDAPSRQGIGGLMGTGSGFGGLGVGAGSGAGGLGTRGTGLTGVGRGGGGTGSGGLGGLGTKRPRPKKPKKSPAKTTP